MMNRLRVSVLLLLALTIPALLFSESKLLEATKNGDISVMKQILDEGGDVNERDSEGMTALMIAARAGNVDLVRFLFQNGIDAKAQNNEGNTALMYATDGGHMQIVQELIQHGINIKAENKQGTTSYMIATNKGYNQIAVLLKNEAMKYMDPSMVGDLLGKALMMIVVGMAIVFSFLQILIWTVQLNAKVIQSLGWDKQEAAPQTASPAVNNKKVVAAISAAIDEFEGKK